MRWILGSSLRFGRLVVALAIGLMAFGAVQFRSAPTDVYPEFMPPSVEIQTEALGLSAAEVEQLITLGLEQDLLNGVPWLDTIHSSSRPGLSTIDLTFQPGTDVYAARQMVQERMTQAHALPNVGSPPIMIQPLASNSRVAMIGMSSEETSLIDMSILAKWKIKPRLMGIPGVANVAVYGQRDRQLQVQVDPKELRDKGVTLTQVIETAGNALWVSPLTFVEASTPGTGGFVESPNQRLAIQHVSPITTSEQLADVPVEGMTGTPPRLGDVAQVIEDHQPLIGDTVAGETPTLFLVIEKFPDADTEQVTRDVEAAMADMQPGLADITVDTTAYRPATFLETAKRNVSLAGLLGLALIVLVLLLLFASWRVAVVGLVVVPVSVTAALTVLHLRGATFTTITVVAVAAGVAVVIDDLVTDVSALQRRAGGGQTVLSAYAAARGPLSFATIALLLILVPFLFVSPLVNAFSHPLLLTYALAVLASMLVSVTLTPTLCALVLRPAPAAGDSHEPGEPDESPIDRGSRRIAAAARTVAAPRRTWAVAGVLAIALLAVIPQIGRGTVLPPLKDRSLLLKLDTTDGTALTEMTRVTAALSTEIRALPGVRSVGAHVGRAVSSDQLVNVNSAEVWVNVAADADYGATREAITAVAAGYAGVRSELVTYPSDRVAQAASGLSDDLVVRVYGINLGTLSTTAAEVRDMLQGVPGISDPLVHTVPTQPTVDVEVDLVKAQKYGLLPGDVRREATTLSSGLTVGSLYEQARVFDVVVLGTPAVRHDLTGFGDILIDSPTSGTVPLADVASVKVTPEPTAIVHDDVVRSIDVAATVTGDPGSVAAAAESRLAGIDMPYEYHAQVFSNAAVERSDLVRVLGLAAGVLVGVFLLLQAAALSWRRAGLVLLSLPLAVAGGVLAAPPVGGVSGLGAMVGLLAVLALALRHGTALVADVRRIELEQADSTVPALWQAARSRVQPVVRTVLLTVAALLPALALGPRAGLELLFPLAVTVFGGLVSLLVVQLVVLPGLLATTSAPHRVIELPSETAAELVPA